MRMRLSRDSVAAGDDVESHDEIREVDPRRPLERLVRELHRDHYLASIQGGRATWIVRTSKNGEALAVFGTRYGDADTFSLVKRTGMRTRCLRAFSSGACSRHNCRSVGVVARLRAVVIAGYRVFRVDGRGPLARQA
jgi:hypothetical protein